MVISFRKRVTIFLKIGLAIPFVFFFSGCPPVVENVLAPVFSPPGGTYSEPRNVEILCNTPGATIYYTLDGTDPATSSVVYTSPVRITENTVIKAFAEKTGLGESGIVTAEYTMTIAAPSGTPTPVRTKTPGPTATPVKTAGPATTDYFMGFEPDEDKSGIVSLNLDEGKNTPFLMGEPTFWTLYLGSMAHSGQGYIISVYNDDGSQNDDWLIFPEMQMTETSELIFWAAPTSKNYAEEELEVLVINDNLETVDSLFYHKFSPGETDYLKFTIDLNVYSSQNVNIAIGCVSTDMFKLRLDDVAIKNIVPVSQD